MNLRINTVEKTIEVLDALSFEELTAFIELNNYRDFTIVSRASDTIVSSPNYIPFIGGNGNWDQLDWVVTCDNQHIEQLLKVDTGGPSIEELEDTSTTDD